MSHKATNWAIQQRGLKPATKIVLWHLCDRHNPDKGCFPEQARLAADCEMSRSTLNLHLDQLEELNLIRREKRHDPVTKKARSTRYHFLFEDGKAVSENRTRETPKAESEKPQKPCPKNGESRVRKSDTNPVREPVREPLSGETARANGADAPEREKKVLKKREAWFWEIAPKWPKFTSSSKTDAMKVWLSLTDEERQLADERMEAYIAACREEGISNKGFCVLKNYFAEKRWQDVKTPVVHKPITCNPFGKPWMAWRFKLGEAAPGIWQPTCLQQTMIDQGKMHLLAPERARGRYPAIARMDSEFKPFNLPADTDLGDLDAYEPVEMGSAEWRAWQDWFDHEGIPRLPEPGSRTGPRLSPGQESKGVFAWFPSLLPPPILLLAAGEEDLEDYEALHGR